MRKRSKYGNKKTEIDGIIFDSKKEGQRWLVLKAACERGEISELKRQPVYELVPAIRESYLKQLKTKVKTCERLVQRPIHYTADFEYILDGVRVVEDVKASASRSALDDVFLLKEKLFRWIYGFSIRRVYSASEQI